MGIRLFVLLFFAFGLSVRAQELTEQLPQELLNFFPGIDGAQLEAELQPMVPQSLPKSGTFWHIPLPRQTQLPPYPCPPQDRLVYSLGNSQIFFVDDSVILSGGKRTQRLVTQPPPPGSGGNGTNMPPRPNIANEAKYAAQFFSHLDTNAVASANTNLYRCITNFPAASAGPVLQIMLFGANCVVVKASHFDYSAESRDFALLICDNPAMSVWKNLSLTAQDTNDGWLVEGTVPNYQVTDPMWMMISNVSTWPAVLRAIPYSGAQVQLAGYQANTVVSNSISLQASVKELSGVTNEAYQVTVDGLPARASLVSGNTFSIDTKYTYNGPVTVYLTANSQPVIVNPTIPPDNAKLHFSTMVSLPLDFENANYLAFPSDNCSPSVGTNYIVFAVSKAQNISATISDPTSGQTVASYGGAVPVGQIGLPWNFTKADGITPYTNDSYVVNIICYDPTTFNFTNKIDRQGVRPGAGCYLTYEYEAPIDIVGIYLDTHADSVINGTLKSLFNNIYSPSGLTQYNSLQVGTNRNHGGCFALTISSGPWSSFVPTYLTNASLYSDFTVAQAHGDGELIGGGPYLSSTFSTYDLENWLLVAKPNWRLRKADLWTCYSGSVADQSNPANPTGLVFVGFPQACGMRGVQEENNSYMAKNCGLFFAGQVPQAGYSHGGITCDLAEFFNQAWVTGPNAFPGGCDPTYSILWAYLAMQGYYPELSNAGPKGEPAIPVMVGYENLIYTSVYDNELLNLDKTHVKAPAN